MDDRIEDDLFPLEQLYVLYASIMFQLYITDSLIQESKLKSLIFYLN